MKELEDYARFPALFRNMQTAYIGFAVKCFGVYKPLIAHIKAGPIRFNRLHDLGSGSGEAAMEIFRCTQVFKQLVLSDKFPNKTFVPRENVHYIGESWDVLEQSFESDKTYLMLNTFHHFSDEEQTRLIEKIIKSKAEAYVVEILRPGLFSLIQVVLMSTVGVLLLTPWIKPFSFTRLLFTYLLPVNVLTILIDGIISVFKSKTCKQYSDLFVHINTPSSTLRVFPLGPKFMSLTLIEIKQK